MHVNSNVSSRAVRWAALFILLATTLSAALVNSRAAEAKMREEVITLVTAAGERSVEIEIAETMEEKARGLMFRSSLADTRGMLFPYGDAQEITMWMRNTYIPLDMVFIRADGVIHRIEANTEPMSERVIASQGPVVAVLELAGGWAMRHGLKAGDRVRHRLFPAQR